MAIDDTILLPVGTVLGGQYAVEGVLGKPGGFGITYLARDTRLGVHVAVKEFFPRSLASRSRNGKNLRPNTPDDAAGLEAGRRKFLEEAQLLARFHHAGIVRVRSFFEEHGTAYLVMDYLDGMPLSQYLDRRGGKLPWETVLGIARPILHALAELHGQNVLHRDVDPHNIYITRRGEVVLLDFGAARVAQAAEGETRPSLSVVLKPGYAPPEQYATKGQGPATDLYAVGATLYRALTGRVPQEATQRLIDDDLVPVREVVPDVPEHVARAVEWALRLRPADRPQNTGALEEALFGHATPAAADDDPLDTLTRGRGIYAPEAPAAPEVAEAPPNAALAAVVEEEEAHEDEPARRGGAGGRWMLAVVLFAAFALAVVWAWNTGALNLGGGGPQAEDDTFSLSEGMSATLPVLDNDRDGEGQGLRLVSFTEPRGGALERAGSSLRYEPADGFVGEDRFTYVVADSEGQQDSAYVVVTVEKSPARVRHEALVEQVYDAPRARLNDLDLWAADLLLQDEFTDNTGWEVGGSEGKCVPASSSIDGNVLLLDFGQNTCQPGLVDRIFGENGGASAQSQFGSASARRELHFERGLVSFDVWRQGTEGGQLQIGLWTDPDDPVIVDLMPAAYRFARANDAEDAAGAFRWNGDRLRVTLLDDGRYVHLFLGNNAIGRVRAGGDVMALTFDGIGRDGRFRIDNALVLTLDQRRALLNAAGSGRDEAL
jgi:tRNA A-37 threonylcarbamoyl transferase component Bud32